MHYSCSSQVRRKANTVFVVFRCSTVISEWVTLSVCPLGREREHILACGCCGNTALLQISLAYMRLRGGAKIFDTLKRVDSKCAGIQDGFLLGHGKFAYGSAEPSGGR